MIRADEKKFLMKLQRQIGVKAQDQPHKSRYRKGQSIPEWHLFYGASYINSVLKRG